jgi:hypothetical protein
VTFIILLSKNILKGGSGCNVKELTYEQKKDIYNEWNRLARKHEISKSEDTGDYKTGQGLRYGEIDISKYSKGPEFFLEQPKDGEKESYPFTLSKHEIIMYIYNKYKVRCMYCKGDYDAPLSY